MAQPPASPPPNQPDRRALLEAYQTLVKSEADRQSQAPISGDVSTARRARWFVLTAIALTLVAVLVSRPTWLFSAPPAPESAAVREASLRLVIYREIQHVEAYRRDHGRLPVDGKEAGVLTPNVSYTAEDSANYTISGSNGALKLDYRSTEPAADFLGNSYQVIRERSHK